MKRVLLRMRAFFLQESSLQSVPICLAKVGGVKAISNYMYVLMAIVMLAACSQQEQKELIFKQTKNYLTVSTEQYAMSFDKEAVELMLPSGAIATLMTIEAVKPKLEKNTVVYKGITEKIDLIFYNKGTGNMGYDLVLQPHANPEDIRLPLEPAADAYLTKNGALAIPLEEGEIRHSKPYTYQEIDGETTEVDSRFALAEGILSFEVGEYDEAYELVIDPTISFVEESQQAAGAEVVESMVMPCVPGNLGGRVFNDNNNNGTEDSEDSGQEGIVVEIYACDATTPTLNTTTDMDGDWSVDVSSITLDASNPVRVEFVIPPSLSYLQPSAAGTDNSTDVQFVDAASCEVKFGVVDPTLNCQDNPPMVTNCYLNGTQSGGVIVSWNYNDAGLISASRPAPTYEANNSQVGTTWGLAYHNATNNVLTSAFLKRHSILIDNDNNNMGDLGAIYSISIDGNTANDNSPLWLDLEGQMDTDGNTISVGSIADNAGRGIEVSGNTPSRDADAFDKVGKVGLGDIDLNAAQDELWVVNLFDKKLYGITVNSDFTPGAIRAFDIPVNQCNSTGGNDARPFAVKYYQGAVYVGVVCSGENTNDLNTVRSYVYRLDDDGVTTTFVEVLNFPMTYSREAPDNNGSCNNINNWRPWRSTWPAACVGTRIVEPQPILSDIEFNINTGEMILGFIDRFGHQAGFLNYEPFTSSTTEFDPVSGGEILKSTPDGDGTFTIESNISSGGEFYDDDFRDAGNPTGHFESSVGGLAMIPGSNFLVSTAFDPIDGTGGQGVFNSGGTIQLNNTTGSKDNGRGYQIYGGNDPGTLGKAAGLGDLELLCDRFPIQVGNYVWNDLDGDGVQDACESGISGLTVKLYTKPQSGNAQLVATTTTNSEGEYYFTGAGTAGETWETGFTEIMAGDSYFILFMGDSYDDTTDEITFGSTVYTLSPLDMGEGNNPDQNDSDVSEMNVPGLGDMPVFTPTHFFAKGEGNSYKISRVMFVLQKKKM